MSQITSTPWLGLFLAFASVLISIVLVLRGKSASPPKVSRTKQYALAEHFCRVLNGLVADFRLAGHIATVESDEKNDRTHVRLWLIGYPVPRAEIVLDFRGNGHGVLNARFAGSATHSFYETDTKFEKNVEDFFRAQTHILYALPPAA